MIILIQRFGLKLSGINTVVLDKKEDIIAKMKNVISNNNIGILVVTEAVYNLVTKELNDIIENRKLPLVVKIP